MKRRLYLNNTISLLYQVCAVIIGLILPRLILQNFGSEVNGVTASITQLLSVISLLDLGVGAVVQSALYKPLVDKDKQRISEIYSRASKYFSTIAKALLIYIVILCFYYGFFKSDTYSWIFTTTLICAIAINYFAQYYFGVVNTLLLNADQKIYIVSLVNLVGLILNAFATVIMLKIGASIQLVKLLSSCVFLLKPLYLCLYVRKNYDIAVIKNPPKDAIKNQWSGLTQHVTVAVTNSIDNVMLTIFGTFSMISIYNVYVLPLNSIRNLMEVTSNSYKSFFGSIIAKEDKKLLLIEFDKYEASMHFLTSIIMSTVLVTLIPFVLVYTSGVNDANYKDVLFCITITLAYVMYILRIIYTNIIFASGKFKETQTYCIIECFLNIVVSLVLVKPLGLSGVAIGTVISSAYRMIISAYYLKKDIIHRSMRPFFIHLIVDFMCFIAMIACGIVLKWDITSFISWILYAATVFVISVIMCTLIHFLAYRKQMVEVVKCMVRRVNK